jgi:hypothetical protein
VKRNDVFIYDSTWMSLKNIMVNERSPVKKTTYSAGSAAVGFGVLFVCLFVN